MSRFVISGFSDEISSSLDIQLEEIQKLNIAYIEMRGVNGKSIVDHTLQEVREVKKKLEIFQVKISAIGSPIGKIDIKDDFEPHFELFKHTVDIAKLLDTKYIRLFSFYIEEGKASNYRKNVITRIKRMVDYVEGTDIVLLHENEKDIYGDTPKRCLDLYNSIDSPHFKLIFDPANFIQCKVETYPFAYEYLKDVVVYYHIKDALIKNGEVVPAGYGDSQLLEIFKDLDNNNYEGFLSLEPHLGYFEGFEKLEAAHGVEDNQSTKGLSNVGKFEIAYNCLKNLLSSL